MTTQTLEQRFDALEKKHDKLALQVKALLLSGSNKRMPRTKAYPKEVITLRNATGLGLMSCKDALERCQGDQQLAEEYLLQHCKGYK